MWRIIMIAVLLGAVAGYKTQSRVLRPLEEIMGDMEAWKSSTETAASTAIPNSAATSTLTTTIAASAAPTTTVSTAAPPIKDEPASTITAEMMPVAALPSMEPEDIDDASSGKRRIITYDQRQEGQYNIRADLENFMIVLIPPSPMEGLNLLDLLTKSSLRRSSHASKKGHKNGFAGAQAATAANRFRQSLKSGNKNQNFNYLARQPLPTTDGKGALSIEAAHFQQRPQSLEPPAPSSASQFQEYIEGRTPYHVDISSNEPVDRHLSADRQVDVLPPPYPLAYQQHLIKPFHLEAEPTVIQALPPPAIVPPHGVNNFLESYTQFLQESNNAENAAAARASANGDYYRVSRAIRSGEHLLDTNSVTSSNKLFPGGSVLYPARRSLPPIYRSDLSFGAAALYPPIDVPHFNGADYLDDSNSRTLLLSSAEDLADAHVGEIMVPTTGLSAESIDALEADLNSTGFGDIASKHQLGEGLERCAPGRRRDSYGVCRQIEGY